MCLNLVQIDQNRDHRLVIIPEVGPENDIQSIAGCFNSSGNYGTMLETALSPDLPCRVMSTVDGTIGIVPIQLAIVFQEASHAFTDSPSIH